MAERLDENVGSCAWCGGDRGGTADPELVITHGICDDCAENLIFHMGIPLHAFLDTLDAPVLVLDRDVVVLTGNSAARALLGKPLADLSGTMGGAVFDCVHVGRPEGCGATAGCSECGVRRLVAETFDSGRGVRARPAVVRRGGAGRGEDLRLSISTERMGEVVLLRIDELAAVRDDGARA
jgi:PAS domain-containing protein